jgi:hypothetical protein
MTEPRLPELIIPRDKLRPALLKAKFFCLHPASRIAWSKSDKGLELFCDGQASTWPASNALINVLQHLSNPGASIPASVFKQNTVCRQVHEFLLLQGSLQAN